MTETIGTADETTPVFAANDVSDVSDAIDVVSQDVVMRACRAALDHELISWADYPEIGEDHWNAIVERVDKNIAEEIARETSSFARAYELLEHEAGTDT